MAEPLKKEIVDSSNGVITPFYDSDTGVVFLAGKVSKVVYFNALRIFPIFIIFTFL